MDPKNAATVVPSQALEAAATWDEAAANTAWQAAFTETGGFGFDHQRDAWLDGHETGWRAAAAVLESVLRTQIAAEINQMQADPHATALQRLGYLTGVADAANLVAAPVHPLPQKGSNT